MADAASKATLDRLLARLDSTVLSAQSDPRLRASQYERNRVSGNIEYARTLLLTLEKQSAIVRIQSERRQLQAGLQQSRESIKRLSARLAELNQLGDDEEDDKEDDEDEDEENEGDGAMQTDLYAPARKDTEAGLDTGGPQGLRIDATQANKLRSRRPLQSMDNRDAASTTAREQLFAARPQPSGTPSELQQNEALLSHNRTEQENLTSGLLGLARALKESSLQFGASLEAEKDVLKRAEGGLDKSAQGMEAAERRMGMLRRMSEGQGWWGRIKLYGFIAGLWLACFLLVFVGPKLRL